MTIGHSLGQTIRDLERQQPFRDAASNALAHMPYHLCESLRIALRDRDPACVGAIVLAAFDSATTPATLRASSLVPGEAQASGQGLTVEGEVDRLMRAGVL